MPVCDERQTPNNKRETKTILNCFSPDWICYVRTHVEKRHGYSRCGGLTTDTIVASQKGARNGQLN